MTDNEIIKALVHCDISHQCEGCPCDFDTNGKTSCMELGENILALINRQKEEIERLKRSLDNMTNALIRTDDYCRAVEHSEKLLKHGHWTDNNIAYVCSLCGKSLVIEQGDADMNYCPNCGARMDGE